MILPNDPAVVVLNAVFGDTTDIGDWRHPGGPLTVTRAPAISPHPDCARCDGTGTLPVPDTILGDWVDTDCPCRWRT